MAPGRRRNRCRASFTSLIVAPSRGSVALFIVMLGRSRTTTCGVGRMPKTLTDLELIRELEPVAEAGMNQHLAATRNWNPHDYVPWSDGSDCGALGGHDWSLDESRHGIALRDYLVVTRAVDP